MSIMHAAMGVSYGVGLVFIGSIGDAVNLHVAFAVGALLLLVGFAVITLRSRHWRVAVDGCETVTGPALAAA
jgi:predicted MFS family arabinose efflux permease